MGITIKCYPYGMFEENTYLITDEATGLKAIIDPGYYSDQVAKDIGDASSLKYLLLTHGHRDHLGAVAEYQSVYKDAIYAAPEADLGIMYERNSPEPDQLLKDADVIELGETKIIVIATPGHTAGGLCFKTDKEIFTGDTLFKMSVGRTDLPTGGWDALVSAIRHQIYTLDDDLIVYPGHGDSTSIGFEKKANPFV